MRSVQEILSWLRAFEADKSKPVALREWCQGHNVSYRHTADALATGALHRVMQEKLDRAISRWEAWDTTVRHRELQNLKSGMVVVKNPNPVARMQRVIKIDVGRMRLDVGARNVRRYLGGK